MKPHQINLIGKHVTITDSKNKQLKGKKGIIENETKHTISIEGKIIIKEQVIMNVEGTIIKGEDLEKQGQERIKVKK